jgi:hypothetical protein
LVEESQRDSQIVKENIWAANFPIVVQIQQVLFVVKKKLWEEIDNKLRLFVVLFYPKEFQQEIIQLLFFFELMVLNSFCFFIEEILKQNEVCFLLRGLNSLQLHVTFLNEDSK